MKRLGQFISWIGVALGGLLGLSLFVPWDLHGLLWIAAVGTTKLVFATALGLMATGAVMQRVALRGAAREQLPPGSAP